VKPEQSRLSAGVGDKPAIELDPVGGGKGDIIEWESNVSWRLINRVKGIKNEFLFQWAAREQQSREQHLRE